MQQIEYKFPVVPAYNTAWDYKGLMMFIKGSAGSGKSRFTALRNVFRMMTESYVNGVAFRKVKDTVRLSVYSEYINTIKLVYSHNQKLIDRDWKITKNPMEIVYRRNGNKFNFLGLDEPDKIRSIASINAVHYEEADESTAGDFYQIITRLRDKLPEGAYHQFVATFNPTSELSHLKVEYFDVYDAMTPEQRIHYGLYCFSTTYLDNPFISDNIRRAYEDLANKDKAFHRIYVLGHWGKTNTKGAVYSAFDEAKHVKSGIWESRDTNNAFVMSWDFNVLPHCSALIGQKKYTSNGGIEILIGKEVTPEHPFNKTVHAARLAGKEISGCDVIVTGDVNGKNKDTRSEIGTNDYIIIEDEIKHTCKTYTEEIPSCNPSVKSRTEFINCVLYSELYNVKIMIDKECVKLIKDLSGVKQDKYGSKKKSTVKDKESGLSYEEFGHLSDCLDYMLCNVLLNDEYDKWIHRHEVKPVEEKILKQEFITTRQR